MAKHSKIKDKRSAILNAALEVITSYGFHGSSMKMIANHTGIAAGTIYVYFKSKEDLINCLFSEIGAEINALIHELYDESKSLKENFIRTWEELLAFYISDPIKPEFMTQYIHSPFITSEHREKGKRFLEPIYEIIEEAQHEHLLINQPSHVLIALCHGPLTSLIRMTRHEGMDLKTIDIKACAQSCWRAIEQQ